MKKIVLCILVAPLISGCATDPFGRKTVESRTTTGVLAGAAVGAAAGKAIGLDPVSGAALGMVVGGAAGYALKGPIIRKRQYYKDTRGYCYYFGSDGVARYDKPPVRC